jgi:multidrug efflux pump
MEQLCKNYLPQGMSYEWTNISYQQVTADRSGVTIPGSGVLIPMVLCIFAFAVGMVFLVLSSLYESWKLPLAIILVVPMCLLSAIAGLAWVAHHPIDIFSQIGFVVLVALAAKNAILIVEYAEAKVKEGLSHRDATLEACRLRLRPILMTSLAFIFGVYPLVIATGAGWEMRRSLGIAVLSGMIGVTLFGIFLTPVFYYVLTLFGGKQPSPKRAEKASHAAPEPVAVGAASDV